MRVTQLSADNTSPTQQLIFVTDDGNIGIYCARTGGCTYVHLPATAINRRVVCASLGPRSGVFCTDDGAVYTFATATGVHPGNLLITNNWGQLGHDDEAPAVANVPRLVNGMVGKKCVCVAAGHSATAACTEDGQLWTWGNAKTIGRTGWDTTVSKRYDPVPRVCDALEGAHVTRVTIGGGIRSYVLCTTDQGVYTFGDKDFGKLGLGNLSGESPLLPQKVAGLDGKSVTDVALSEVHSVVCNTNGDVFTFGKGGDMLGYSGPGHQRVPKMLDSFLEI